LAGLHVEMLTINPCQTDIPSERVPDASTQRDLWHVGKERSVSFPPPDFAVPDR
jgi:hypothetical protein